MRGSTYRRWTRPAKKQTVGAEWASASRLKIQGITTETLKIGDHLVLTGSPSRDPQDTGCISSSSNARPTAGNGWAGTNLGSSQLSALG